MEAHIATHVEAIPPYMFEIMRLPPREIQRRVTVRTSGDGACMDENVRERAFRLDDDGAGDVLRFVPPAEASEQGAEDEADGAQLECCDGHAEARSAYDVDDEPGELEHRDDASERVELVLVVYLRIRHQDMAVVNMAVSDQIV